MDPQVKRAKGLHSCKACVRGLGACRRVCACTAGPPVCGAPAWRAKPSTSHETSPLPLVEPPPPPRSLLAAVGRCVGGGQGPGARAAADRRGETPHVRAGEKRRRRRGGGGGGARLPLGSARQGRSRGSVQTGHTSAGPASGRCTAPLWCCNEPLSSFPVPIPPLSACPHPPVPIRPVESQRLFFVSSCLPGTVLHLPPPPAPPAGAPSSLAVCAARRRQCPAAGQPPGGCCCCCCCRLAGDAAVVAAALQLLQPFACGGDPALPPLRCRRCVAAAAWLPPLPLRTRLLSCACMPSCLQRLLPPAVPSGAARQPEPDRAGAEAAGAGGAGAL